MLSSQKNNQNVLFTYLINRLGGPDEVVRQFRDERVRNLAQEGKTFQDLFDTASREGWGNELHDMTLKDVVSALQTESTLGVAKKVKTRGCKRGRKLKKLSIKIRDEILSYLAEYTKGSRSEMAQALRTEPENLNLSLRSLSKNGLILMHGKKKGAFYTLSQKGDFSTFKKASSFLSQLPEQVHEVLYEVCGFAVFTPSDAYMMCERTRATPRQIRGAMETLVKNGSLIKVDRGQYQCSELS